MHDDAAGEGGPLTPRLSDATRYQSLGEGRFRGEIPEDWVQGRTAFGGLLGAAAVRAAQPEGRPLRSLVGSFVGPAEVGPVELTTEVLREGGSMTQVEARVVQGGRVCAVFGLAFGVARPTRVPLPGPGAPEQPPPESLPAMPYVAGLMPAFTRHMDFRWTVDGLPFMGGDEAHVQGWIRTRVPEAADAPLLVALLDAWPPPIWSILQGPARGSSVQWQVSLGALPEVPPGAWWRYEARSTSSGEGYSDFAGHLWDEQGRWVASTRQLFAEFSGSRVTEDPTRGQGASA